MDDLRKAERTRREAAWAAVEAAAGRAARDPARPVYHLLPPAPWMNDVCGTIHHRGWYHVCYLINPFGDHIAREQTWGHARSRDLVHWEHLPLPFWPAGEAWEEGIYTGGAAVNGHGQPMYFWTANPRQGSGRRRTVGAAVSDGRMVRWRKLPGNPIMRRGRHGDPEFDGEWDAPFLFTEQGRTFLLLSALQDGDPILPLYEAVTPDLTRWTYRGIMFRTSRSEVREIECQNFVRIGDRWVLLYSPDDTRMRYCTGRFDLRSLRFEPETSGIVNHAYGPGNDRRERGFYASNVLLAPGGRKLLFGWVSGFRDADGALYMQRGEGRGRGWNGCVSLPRAMALDLGGRLLQTPAAELLELRGAPATLPRTTVLQDAGRRVPGSPGSAFEVVVWYRHGTAAVSGLRLVASGRHAVEIGYDGRVLHVAGTEVSLPLDEREPLRLHLYVDRSVLEVFIDGGRECVTRVIEPLPPEVAVEVFAHRGRAVIEGIIVWPLRSIW